MTITESVKTFLLTCPLFEGKEININYLEEKPTSFSLENVPASSVIKRYSDGGTLRQFCFILASREAYDNNCTENLKTAQFFEELALWIDRQNRAKNLPDLSSLGGKAEQIEISESGAICNTAVTSAQFQIKLKLIYKQDF